MKTCPACGVEKDASQFGKNKRRKEGAGPVCGRTPEPSAPKTPKLIAFREWINKIKDEPCLDCDLEFPPEAMDFDHVEGQKILQISDMWSWGREKVIAEIVKCELGCANCHRERTVFRMREAA